MQTVKIKKTRQKWYKTKWENNNKTQHKKIKIHNKHILNQKKKKNTQTLVSRTNNNTKKWKETIKISKAKYKEKITVTMQNEES